MATPRYFVTASAEPGIVLPPVGLLPPGSTFSAPESFIPSVHLRAMNEEALEPLALSFEATAERLTERLEEATGADRVKVRAELDALVAKQATALVVIAEDEIGALRSKMVGPAARDLP